MQRLDLRGPSILFETIGVTPCSFEPTDVQDP